MDVANSSAELVSLFKSAADGAIIELAAGNYGAVTLEGQHFTHGITITSQDLKNRAVFTDTLALMNASGVTLEGIDLIAAQLANAPSQSRLSVTNSSAITLSDILVQGHVPVVGEGADPMAPDTRRVEPIVGYGFEIGLKLRAVQNVTVSTVELADLRIGAAVSNVRNSTLSGLDIHSVREGIDLNDIQNLVIENSYIHDLKKWQPRGRGDHPDMIQYWGVQSKFGIDGLTIKDNYFHQPAGGYTQTIFGGMHPERSGLTAKNFVITGNVIVNAHPNAIRLHDVNGVEVSGNTLLPNMEGLDFRFYPAIFFGNVTNATVTGNTVMPRWQTGAVLPLSASELKSAHIHVADNLIMSTNPASPAYWKIVYGKVTAWAAQRFGL